MDIHEQIEQLVADWVKHNFLYLKDGDGTRGLHPVVRLDLKERIEGLCHAVRTDLLDGLDGGPLSDVKPAKKKKKSANVSK